MNSISISSWLAKAITLTKKHYFTILKYYMIFIILGLVLGMTFVGVILVPGLVIASIKVMLSIARDEDFSLMDCLKHGITNGMWWKSIWFFIIYLVGIFLATLLLVFPMFYVVSIWYLSAFIFIDYNLSPMEAFRESKRIVSEIGVLKVLGYIAITIIIEAVFTVPFYNLVGYDFIGTIMSLLIAPLSTMLPIGLYLSVDTKPKSVEE